MWRTKKVQLKTFDFFSLSTLNADFKQNNSSYTLFRSHWDSQTPSINTTMHSKLHEPNCNTSPLFLCPIAFSTPSLMLHICSYFSHWLPHESDSLNTWEYSQSFISPEINDSLIYHTRYSLGNVCILSLFWFTWDTCSAARHDNTLSDTCSSTHSSS